MPFKKIQRPAAGAQKRGQRPIVRSTSGAIWLLVPEPFSEPIVKEGNTLMPHDRLLISQSTLTLISCLSFMR